MTDPLTMLEGISAMLDIRSHVVSLIRTAKFAASDRQKPIAEDSVEINSAEPWELTFQVLNQDDTGPRAQFEQSLRYLGAKLGKERFSLTWPFTKEGLQEMLTSIERQKSMFAIALTNDSIRLSAAITVQAEEITKGVDVRIVEITKSVDIIRHAHESHFQAFESSCLEVVDHIHGLSEGTRKKREILSRLMSIAFEATHADIASRRANGTGERLLETREMLCWLKTPEILRCQGIPVSAKTILASLVIDKLRGMVKEDLNLGVAGIYCSCKEPETTSNLIGSLIRQLAEPLETIPRSLEALNRLDAFHTISGLYSKIMIIVDTLDECADRLDLVKQLLTMLIMKSATKIHILVTSRKDLTDVERTLKADLQLDIISRERDVRLFLQQNLRDHERVSGWIIRDTVFEASIIDAILGRLYGIILLTLLCMELPADIPTKRGIRKALETLPVGTDDNYKEAWVRIGSQKSQQAKIGKQILAWVVHATRPLTVQEVQYALAIEPGDEDLDLEGLLNVPDWTSFCAVLIVIDGKHDLNTLVHPTRQEFFQNQKEALLPTAHEDIAETCITYLRMKRFRSYEAIHFQADLLFNYAALHWDYHVCCADNDKALSLALQLLDDENGRSTAAQLLIERSPSIYWKQRIGRKVSMKPVHLVAYFGLSRLVGRLDLNTDINDGSDKTGSPIYWALEGNQNQMLKVLLEHGADANALRFQAYADARSGDSGYNSYPLITATKMGNITALGYLLQHGASVDQSRGGSTISSLL
ncbi:hypothetical protein OEA41_009844 [Lepraria neglecta]|uniref:Ankyrin n=1 Tax=Lepraria neglecta TaxID=209136 RepID=A0AAE0DER6_9LECA|nr:hypothetical protein OEA41_009844 [Lepraria neglecta]